MHQGASLMDVPQLIADLKSPTAATRADAAEQLSPSGRLAQGAAVDLIQRHGRRRRFRPPMGDRRPGIARAAGNRRLRQNRRAIIQSKTGHCLLVGHAAGPPGVGRGGRRPKFDHRINFASGAGGSRTIGLGIRQGRPRRLGRARPPLKPPRPTCAPRLARLAKTAIEQISATP